MSGGKAVGNGSATLPRLGAGGASRFLTLPDEECVELLNHAYDKGIRYFDTAPYYGRGLSELRFGNVLRGLPRESITVSSKVGRLLKRDAAAASPGKLPFGVLYDYSYDGVMRSLEDSWKRLKMDRIDIVYIHDCSPAWRGDQFDADFQMAVEGGYRALDELRSSGVIGAIGVGIQDIDVCVRFAREVDLDVLMLAGGYTLLETGALDQLLPLCHEKGTAVAVASPFNSGILALGSEHLTTYFYKPTPPEIVERVKNFEVVCARHNVPLGAAAIQFPFSHPAVTTIVAGYASTNEVDKNIEWAQTPIPNELWRELRAEGLLPGISSFA